jgi:hypothetical protein
MEKIDKISKIGNILFVAMLYTAFTISIGFVIGDHITKHYQAERFVAYDWYDGDCFDRVDINWIIYGLNE